MMSRLTSRYKIPEGIGLTEWPEFKAMVAALDVPEVPTDAAVTVLFPAPDEAVEVVVNGQSFESDLTGFEAWRSSEVRAWLTRLGVPVEQFVVSLSVDFAVGVFPTYTMKAALTDEGER